MEGEVTVLREFLRRLEERLESKFDRMTNDMGDVRKALMALQADWTAQRSNLGFANEFRGTFGSPDRLEVQLADLRLADAAVAARVEILEHVNTASRARNAIIAGIAGLVAGGAISLLQLLVT